MTIGHRAYTIIVGLLIVSVFFPGTSLFSQETKALVKSGGVDLRARPTIESDTVVKIKGGEAVLLLTRLSETDTVSGVTGHWYSVQYRGIDGWIFDSSLDTANPEAENLYRDLPSLTDQMKLLYEAKESGALEETVSLATQIVGEIEGNFTKHEIRSSQRLSEMILISLVDKIEALSYLHRFDAARAHYDYLIKNYPDAMLQDGLVGVQELVGPYMVFTDRYKSAPLFSNLNEPRERLTGALEKRDITKISNLAVPGVFEVRVANTDWWIKLGKRNLTDESWLSLSWEEGWKMGVVDETTDEGGRIIGYCIVTEPWDIDYYGFPVHRVDFCIDRLPDGACAFSYMILYTTPSQ